MPIKINKKSVEEQLKEVKKEWIEFEAFENFEKKRNENKRGAFEI